MSTREKLRLHQEHTNTIFNLLKSGIESAEYKLASEEDYLLEFSVYGKKFVIMAEYSNTNTQFETHFVQLEKKKFPLEYTLNHISEIGFVVSFDRNEVKFNSHPETQINLGGVWSAYNSKLLGLLESIISV